MSRLSNPLINKISLFKEKFMEIKAVLEKFQCLIEKFILNLDEMVHL